MEFHLCLNGFHQTNVANLPIYTFKIKQHNQYNYFNKSNIKFSVLYVAASPTGLVLNGSSQPIDLSGGGVDLICTTTNCVYPTPRYFQWLYKEADVISDVFNVCFLNSHTVYERGLIKSLNNEQVLKCALFCTVFVVHFLFHGLIP